MTIHKFPFEIVDRIFISLPTAAEVLAVQVQNGKPTMWILLDPNASRVPRSYSIYGTGHPVNNSKDDYIGTIQLDGFVWHIFENL